MQRQPIEQAGVETATHHCGAAHHDDGLVARCVRSLGFTGWVRWVRPQGLPVTALTPG